MNATCLSAAHIYTRAQHHETRVDSTATKVQPAKYWVSVCGFTNDLLFWCNTNPQIPILIAERVPSASEDCFVISLHCGVGAVNMKTEHTGTNLSCRAPPTVSDYILVDESPLETVLSALTICIFMLDLDFFFFFLLMFLFILCTSLVTSTPFWWGTKKVFVILKDSQSEKHPWKHTFCQRVVLNPKCLCMYESEFQF